MICRKSTLHVTNKPIKQINMSCMIVLSFNNFSMAKVKAKKGLFRYNII